MNSFRYSCLIASKYSYFSRYLFLNFCYLKEYSIDVQDSNQLKIEKLIQLRKDSYHATLILIVSNLNKNNKKINIRNFFLYVRGVSLNEFKGSCNNSCKIY
jgi:hypothetical protein